MAFFIPLVAGKLAIGSLLFGREILRATTSVGVTHLAFKPDEDIFAAATPDGRVVWWEARRQKKFGETYESHASNIFMSTSGRTNCVEWSPDGDNVFTGGEGRLGDVLSQLTRSSLLIKEKACFEVKFPVSGNSGHNTEVDDLACSPGGVLASLSIKERSVKLWSKMEQQQGYRVWGPSRVCHSLAQSLQTVTDAEPLSLGWGETVAHGLLLAVACKACILVFHASTGIELQRLEIPCECSARTCRWSPCGAWLACAVQDGSVLVYGTDSWELVNLGFQHGGRAVTGLSWSPVQPCLLATVAGGADIVITAPHTARVAGVLGAAYRITASENKAEMHTISWGRRFLATACTRGYVYVYPVNLAYWPAGVNDGSLGATGTRICQCRICIAGCPGTGRCSDAAESPTCQPVALPVYTSLGGSKVLQFETRVEPALNGGIVEAAKDGDALPNDGFEVIHTLSTVSGAVGRLREREESLWSERQMEVARPSISKLRTQWQRPPYFSEDVASPSTQDDGMFQ